MKRFLCGISYIPNNESSVGKNTQVNFTCSDGKIHIRFKDFSSEELIQGFEAKLTYLLTYLMNYSYLPKIIGTYDEDTLIDGFLKSQEILKINLTINSQLKEIGVFSKGFIVRKNYKKQIPNKIHAFGDVVSDCFPLIEHKGITEQGSLDSFLDLFHVSLIDYLFNDSYIILIRENCDYDPNKKFIKRMLRKADKIKNKNSDLTELW